MKYFCKNELEYIILLSNMLGLIIAVSDYMAKQILQGNQDFKWFQLCQDLTLCKSGWLYNYSTNCNF